MRGSADLVPAPGGFPITPATGGPLRALARIAARGYTGPMRVRRFQARGCELVRNGCGLGLGTLVLALLLGVMPRPAVAREPAAADCHGHVAAGAHMMHDAPPAGSRIVASQTGESPPGCPSCHAGDCPTSRGCGGSGAALAGGTGELGLLPPSPAPLVGTVPPRALPPRAPPTPPPQPIP